MRGAVLALEYLQCFQLQCVVEARSPQPWPWASAVTKRCYNDALQVTAAQCCAGTPPLITARSGISAAVWNGHTVPGMEVLCLSGAERADRNGSVHQPRSGAADGTTF